MTTTITRTCPVCGRDYTPQRTDFGRGQFCSVRCANKGNTFAIVPSETKPARTKPMTDAEFERELALIRRQLTERGMPLTRLDGIAAQEKPERIAAAVERERRAA